MPKGEEFIEDMEDVSLITDEAGDANSVEQSANAGSSAAAEDVSNTVADDDALSVVRDVVDQRQAETAASSATEEDGQTTDGTNTQEMDNEGFADVPFNKHPRFQELLRQRNDFKVDAERYQNVQGFLDQNGLAADEAANLLLIGGLMKTNPAEAWRMMRPTVQRILIAAGEVLPDDLKQLVDGGEMSAAAALEVSRSRAQSQSYTAQRQFDQQRDQQHRQNENVAAINKTISTWELGRRQRDPNFEAKLPAIQKEIAWLQATEGKPNTPEGVQAQLNKAYEAVASVSATPAVNRQKPAIRPINGGQANGNVRPSSGSTLDIIKAEVSKRGVA